LSSSVPSYLVNKQTSEPIDSIPSYGDVLRRSCHRQYAAALRIYTILDGGPENGRAQRLQDCRQNAWFSRHKVSGEVRVASSACSLRWCPVCRNARRNFMTHTIAEWIVGSDHPKLVTLTLKHTQAPLYHQIDHLYKFFRTLKRRKDFRNAVSGGVWFFQITQSKTDGTWHPHIHAIITGKYLPKRRLSRMWSQVTYGSFVTDIRAVHDPQGVATDVARYATSPCDLSNLAPDDAIEVVESLHGRRICGKWGTANVIQMRPDYKGEKGKWESLGSWSYVMNLLEHDQNAKAIVFSWKTGKPLEAGINCRKYEDFVASMGDQAWAEYNFESVYDHERSPP